MVQSSPSNTFGKINNLKKYFTEKKKIFINVIKFEDRRPNDAEVLLSRQGVAHRAALFVLAMSMVTTAFGSSLCFPLGRVDHFGRAIHQNFNLTAIKLKITQNWCLKLCNVYKNGG